MGNDLSHAQEEHVRELKEIVKRNYFQFNSAGKAQQVKGKEIKELLKYVWEHMSYYPLSGSTKVSTWRKIGEDLHNVPRAPAPILCTWRSLIEALQIQNNPLLQPPPDSVIHPPPYQPVLVQPAATTAVRNHGLLLPPSAPALSEPSLAPRRVKNAVDAGFEKAMENGELSPEELINLPVSAFPVVVEMDGVGNEERVWRPLELRTLREITTAVKDYGLKSKYTTALLEALAFGQMMIPEDWKALARMILSSGQYIVWDFQYRQQALARGTGLITPDQLYGSGQFNTVESQRDDLANDVFPMINLCVLAAFTRIDEAGGSSIRSFVTIKQGNAEPYQDFITKLKTAIGKSVDNDMAAAELLQKLAVENVNADCKAILKPLIATGQKEIAQMIEAYAAVGSQIHQMDALAAAMTRGIT